MVAETTLSGPCVLDMQISDGMQFRHGRVRGAEYDSSKALSTLRLPYVVRANSHAYIGPYMAGHQQTALINLPY